MTSRHQDAAAVVAVRDGPGRALSDALRFHRRDGEWHPQHVLPFSRAAPTPRALAASLIIFEETGIDGGGDLVAGGALAGQLFVDLRFELGQCRAEALRFGLELAGARTEPSTTGSNDSSALHDLELAVLETAPVTPKLFHVRLERLELSR